MIKPVQKGSPRVRREYETQPSVPAGGSGTRAEARSAFVGRDGWVLCPLCWSKLMRVDSDAVVRGAHTYCRKCKAEREVKMEGH